MSASPAAPRKRAHALLAGGGRFLLVLTAFLPATAATATSPAPIPQSSQSGERPDSFDGLQGRAAIAREAGELDEALVLYRKALALRSDWDEGRWYVASMLYELERYTEASDAFTEVLSHQPTHAGAIGLRGLCRFRLRQYEGALVDLLQATRMGVARTPGIAIAVRYHAAILLTRFGDFEVANQMLTEFAAEGTETPEIIEAFGLNVLRLPLLPAEASADARAMVMLAGRAGYALAARQIDAARRAIDDLVARYPKTPNVHYVRGVFLLTEDADRALEAFRHELTISPSHVPARLQIAFEFLKRGEPERARAAAAEAVKLEPEHFAARLALGQVLLETNSADRAIAELEQAAVLAPESPQTHFLLARAYARIGRAADAERARAEFTRLDQMVRSLRQGRQAVGGIPSAGPPKWF